MKNTVDDAFQTRKACLDAIEANPDEVNSHWHAFPSLYCSLRVFSTLFSRLVLLQADTSCLEDLGYLDIIIAQGPLAVSTVTCTLHSSLSLAALTLKSTA